MVNQSIYMRFPKGLKKAVTLSYDDGVEQDFKLVSLLKKYHMKGTFNIDGGCLAKEGTVYQEGQIHRRMSLSQCLDCYDLTVCEIAAHTDTHPRITTLPSAMMMNQVIEDRKKLESMFGHIVKGMAYPYGMYNDTLVEVLRLAGICYCRTVRQTHEFSVPTDWLRLHPTCHHDDAMLFELAEHFLSDEVMLEPQMFYLWGHSYEFEQNDNWDVIEKFLQQMSGREDIWYATNIEIYEYTRAFKMLEFSVDGKQIHNPSAMDLWLEIDGELISIPAGGDVK